MVQLTGVDLTGRRAASSYIKIEVSLSGVSRPMDMSEGAWQRVLSALALCWFGWAQFFHQARFMPLILIAHSTKRR